MALDYRIGADDKRMIVVFDDDFAPDDVVFSVDLPNNEQASKPIEDAIIGMVNAKNEQQQAQRLISKMYEMMVSLGVEDSMMDQAESYLARHKIAHTPSISDDYDINDLDTMSMK